MLKKTKKFLASKKGHYKVQNVPQVIIILLQQVLVGKHIILLIMNVRLLLQLQLLVHWVEFIT